MAVFNKRKIFTINLNKKIVFYMVYEQNQLLKNIIVVYEYYQKLFD